MALGAISVLLLIDVNEWINKECSECMTYHLNISLCFTRLHQSKRENQRKNCKCTQAFTLHNRKTYTVPCILQDNSNWFYSNIRPGRFLKTFVTSPFHFHNGLQHFTLVGRFRRVRDQGRRFCGKFYLLYDYGWLTN